MPQIIILGGCNGAGKTTAAYSILRDVLEVIQFINADEIAKGLSPFAPETVAIEAGRIMLDRLKELASAGRDFAFETTLASRTFVPFLKECKKMGYQVEMLFFYLDNPELARERVNSRVAAGGHNIPDDVIIRRYSRGLDNFLNLYVNLCDQWGVYNNSTGIPVLIANGEKDSIKEIELKQDWAKILEYAKK
ncbi:MAG: zeta toxin family protein [Bacteroidia bacterium]|nr:zeta toxin family protein [Bacteroidia bacterium]